MATPAAALTETARRVAEFERCFASESAFRAFYDEALPRVYGYLLNRCRGDRALATPHDAASTTLDCGAAVLGARARRHSAWGCARGPRQKYRS